jgi:hypothetical protein
MESVINGKLVRLNLRTGEIFMQFRNTGIWKVNTGYGNGDYLRMNINKKQYYLHRVIYKINNPEWNIDDCSTNNSIDHINRTPSDNSIQNLRNVTNQQNQHNKASKGYYFNKKLNKWRAKIYTNGKHIHLGLFDLEADARDAYLEAKKVYHII